MLTIENLQVNYSESKILQDVNVEVPSGQLVCLVGRNGVGKTTLLKSIMGVLKANTGKIKYDGNDITNWAPHDRARAGIGYVPQGRGIFPFLTVKENLLMGLEAVKDKKQNNLQSLQSMYEMFPVLQEMSERSAGALSGGQQQQLALARALISKPRLLLLDEPTEGLQPSIVQEIEATLLKLHKQGDTSIVLVEQFLDFALAVATYCYVMDRGNIVFSGLPTSLTDDVVKEYMSI